MPRCSAPVTTRPKGPSTELDRRPPNAPSSPNGYTNLKARQPEQTWSHSVVLVRFGAICAVRLRTMPWVSPPAFTGLGTFSQTERLKAKHPLVFLHSAPKGIDPARVDPPH